MKRNKYLGVPQINENAKHRYYFLQNKTRIQTLLSVWRFHIETNLIKGFVTDNTLGRLNSRAVTNDKRLMAFFSDSRLQRMRFVPQSGQFAHCSALSHECDLLFH